ncbi:phage tail spike protein [Streptococcus mitis]|uniref:phage tail spike protein n=1 Tax=Streptococcus mitis TaxID=28037 RepID=UPI0039EECDC5
MIYLTNGNMPLNAAYADEIVQEDNSTYQLTFRFPTSDSLWEQLKEETFLTADDLHGEQDFVIFEVEKKHGYIQVYANQVFTLLNNYVVNPISLDRQTGSTALSRFAGAITRNNPFSFFSDIEDRHTFNIGSKNAMEAFAKDKHSILGQWGGDLVRHGYQVRLLKNGGSENESLFMYKKNLSSYQHKTSTKSLKTRITFIATVKGEGEKAPDRTFTVTLDSPLINKYSQIYEDVIEVNDQDVKDEASLRKYGEQYFRTTLCDMMEDSLELEVVGQSDVPVQMFDIVSLFHDVYNLDVRKKITKYTYSPMGKKLKTIGFGQFKSGLANAIGNAVSDAVKGEAQQLQSDFERQLARELKNADLAFDRQKEELVNQFTDGLNAAKARAEEVKRELSDTIDQRFSSFNNGPLQEAKRRTEEALRNAGASSLLAQEAKQIGLDSVAKLEEFRRQATSAQMALSGDLDALKRTVTSEVNQASEYRRTTTEALSRMTGQMNGFATKSEVRQDVTGLTETFAKLKTDTNNLISGAKSEITLAKTEFKKTADGLSAKMSAVESYVGQDGQRQEALRRYTREESARQVSTVREQISRDYVGKSAYQEDVRGLERRFSAMSTQTNNDIASKIAQYKQTVDGQFASIISQIASKANQTDFQRVRETSQLYERIIGGSESDIAEKVARMVMTNQLFQVEVSKYANVGGPNMLRNSRADDALKHWTEDNSRLGFTAHGFYFNGQKRMFELRPGAVVKSNRFLVKRNADYILNILGFDNNSKYFRVYFCKRKKDSSMNFQQKQLVFDGKTRWVDGSVFDNSRAVKKTFKFNVGDYDDGYLQFEYDRNNPDKWGGLFMTELDFYEGTTDRLWQPAPEDATLETDKTLEATQTKMTQLAGSWSVQNINSAGDLISGLNLGANGHNRLDGKLTHITGETLIDKAVIKSAMVDKLKTANFEAGSVTTVVLDAEAVTAEKIKVDQALFNKLVANEAYLSQLFAKQAFINRVQSVAIDASQVRSGILSGDRIYGGTIRGANIFGGTLTGHTKIQLGSYGSFDTVNGGLQINVPRDYNAKDGLGVQFIGSYGRGENVPYGLFLYRDSDFTIGNTATDTDEFLMTVQGYINAKGIGWLKTGKGSVNGKTTGTIGLWNSDNVSLSFGGSGNDIYYSYNSTAYSLWSVVNQHFSDRRLKENIVDCKHKALDYIHQFQFKEYDWKKQEDRPQQAHTKIGLIAQEVQTVDPTLVYKNGDTLNLDNLRLTNIALKAIQELALENRKLTQRLENLENERRTA